MANPTTNYGFVLPTATDLVTDLPADFDVALQGVDTRLKALQPGTTLGDLAYSSATANTNTRLAVGTTGQILTVAGGVPSWATPAGGGGMTLLASGSISSDPTTISSISQDYKELVFYAIDWKSGSANNTYVRFNGDGGSNYYTVQVTQNNTIFSSGVGVAQTAASVIGPDRGTVNDNNLVLRIPNYTAAAYKVASAISFITNDGNTTFGTTNTTIGYKSTTAISSLSITTCTSGSYELYGVK
jgi:hypothetical protein